MISGLLNVEDLSNLHVKIRVLGYSPQGETICLSFVDGENEYYTVVTDCYEIDGVRGWSSILPEQTTLFAFVWTHPDDDHSQGINKLMDTFDEDGKAHIFLPIGLTKKYLEENGKSQAATEFENLRKKYNVGRKYQWNEISLGEGEDARRLISILIREKISGRELTAIFGFFLPNGALVSRRLNEGLGAGEANDFSVVYYMELNGARYLFTGDLANQSIQFINSDWTKDCRFVKIPHHGSKDPVRLIPLISPYEDKMVSVCTVYNTTHPYPEVIDKYKAISSKVISTDKGGNGYGLVELDFYVTDIDKDQEQLVGDAKVL